MRSFLLITFLFFLFSCKVEKKLDYNSHKLLYNNAVTCLFQKRQEIFRLQDSILQAMQAISIYKDDLDELKLCKETDTLFQMEPLNFISLEKDGTVSFFAITTGNTFLGTKQFGLMYLKDSGLLASKINGDMKVKKINPDGWYALERIISMAN